MSFSAALLLATAVAVPLGDAAPAQRVVLAEAGVTVRILPAAAVRQADGLQPRGESAPRVQISRRGNTILAEFQ